MTGLYNRRIFDDYVLRIWRQSRREDVAIEIIFVDIDNFKIYNDLYGHQAGDDCLKRVAQTIARCAKRPFDFCARYGGEEFVLILPDADSIAAVRRAEALRESVKQLRIQHRDRLLEPITISIGVASTAALGDGGGAELFRAADAALYRAKQSGRNAFQFFTAEINQRTRARALLGAELRRALEREEFTLAYQPKYDLVTLQPCGGEALLRWNHPERGLVPPSQFVHVLEESGLIARVGEWLLRRACADVKACAAAGVQPVPVAVKSSDPNNVG